MENPLRIYCQNCGAPATFDIIHQTYRCEHCGETNGLTQSHNQVKTWRKLKQADLSHRLPDHDFESCQCPSCGATVIFDAGEASVTCDFCGSKLVHKKLTQEEHLPEMIIPFFITLDEAKTQLKKYADQYASANVAQSINKHLDELHGYYLPYELVYGPVSGYAVRYSRPYHFEGYLNCSAINTSQQFDNILLDDIEPFDFSQAVPFDYPYIAGSKVKLNDLSQDDLKKRIISEASYHYEPVVAKTLHTPDINVHLTSDEFISIPALLPVYFIKTKQISVFVNGQTGRIVATRYKTEKRSYGIIEPLIYTILATLLTCIPYGGIYLDIASLFATVYALIFFGLFEGEHFSVIKMISSKSENTKASRQEDQLIIKPAKDQRHYEPVFYELNRQKERVPVKLRFFTLKRTLLMIINMIWITFMPAIIAVFIRWCSKAPGEHLMDGLAIQYGLPWYIIGGFICIIYWCKGFRQDVFDHPLIYEIKGTRLKRISKFSDEHLSVLSLFGLNEVDANGHRFTLWDFIKDAPGFAFGMLALFGFIFLGSLAAILF